MTRFAILALALGLTACQEKGANPVSSSASSASMAAASWNFQYSPGMPDHPSAVVTGWTFNFPPADGVHYLVTGVSMKATAQVAASVSVSGTGTFQHKADACPNPASVRLFLQRKGDDMSGVGVYEFYRWWSTSVFLTLAPGASADLVVPVSPEHWTSVMGRSGNAVANLTVPAFKDAMANLGAVGFTFGGGCAFGHGVWVTGGSAKFTTTSFVVK